MRPLYTFSLKLCKTPFMANISTYQIIISRSEQEKKRLWLLHLNTCVQFVVCIKENISFSLSYLESSLLFSWWAEPTSEGQMTFFFFPLFFKTWNWMSPADEVWGPSNSQPTQEKFLHRPIIRVTCALSYCLAVNWFVKYWSKIPPSDRMRIKLLSLNCTFSLASISNAF